MVEGMARGPLMRKDVIRRLTELFLEELFGIRDRQTKNPVLPKNYIRKPGLVRRHHGSSRFVFHPRSGDIVQIQRRWNWFLE